MSAKPELLASYFTLAGEVSPLAALPASPFDLRDRIEAAGQAGFRGIGLHGADLKVSLARHGYSTITAMLEDNGLKYIELELLQGWCETEAAALGHAVDHEFLFEAAERLGARHIKVGTGGCAKPAEVMAERLASLCDQAAQSSAALVVEYSPIGSLASLSEAATLIQAAGRASAAILLDIWHILRTGTDLSEIAALSPGLIGHVELCDGLFMSAGSYLDDTINRRRPCGEGQFPIESFLSVVASKGFNGPYGVEILSDHFRALPPKVAAKQAFDTCMAACTRASTP